MAIHSFSGGDGGITVNPHTVDGDTVAHWALDGNLTDDGGGGYTLAGTYRWAPLPNSGAVCHKSNATDPIRRSGYTAALDHTSWANPNQTLAMALYINTYVASDILRHDTFTGGNSKWRWYCNASGNPVIGMDTVAGWEAEVSTLVVPLKTWTYFAITWNTDGKSGVFRVGSDEEAWTATNPTNIGATGSLTVADAWDGTPDVCVSSVIMKDITCTTAQLDAMQAQVGLY